MAENLDVFGSGLTDDEMTRIAALETATSMFCAHRNPHIVSQLGNTASPDIATSPGEPIRSGRSG